MYIAYSALPSVNTGAAPSQTNPAETNDNELSLRYQAYQTTCNKYRREIAEIQRYLPNWRPSPPTV